MRNMEDKNIKKYNELEEEYFSSCPNCTYEWRIGSSVHVLDFDFDNERYDYFIDSKHIKCFSSIYEALDGSILISV